jgi:Peptidase family M23
MFEIVVERIAPPKAFHGALSKRTEALGTVLLRRAEQLPKVFGQKLAETFRDYRCYRPHPIAMGSTAAEFALRHSRRPSFHEFFSPAISIMSVATGPRALQIRAERIEALALREMSKPSSRPRRSELLDDHGTSVRATASGIVTFAGLNDGYGNMVDIDQGVGLTTRYAHLSAIEAVADQKVEAGAILGTIGSTGPISITRRESPAKPSTQNAFLRAETQLFGHPE